MDVKLTQCRLDSLPLHIQEQSRMQYFFHSFYGFHWYRREKFQDPFCNASKWEWKRGRNAKCHPSYLGWLWFHTHLKLPIWRLSYSEWIPYCGYSAQRHPETQSCSHRSQQKCGGTWQLLLASNRVLKNRALMNNFISISKHMEIADE